MCAKDEKGREGFSGASMKTPLDPFRTLGAATIAGVALWLSRASFDVAGTTAAPVRVAMLPSLAELVGFVALALLIAAGWLPRPQQPSVLGTRH